MVDKTAMCIDGKRSERLAPRQTNGGRFTWLCGDAERVRALTRAAVAGFRRRGAAKMQRNRRRDRKTVRELRRRGWEVLVLWECQLRRREALLRRLAKFLGNDRI